MSTLLVTASIEDLLPRFLAILSTHRGLAQAISVADMAGRLGFDRNKAGQRRAQLVKAAAVEAGHLVGSSCGSSHGWFWPETPSEVEATCRQYEARIRSLARLIRMTRGAAGFKAFVGQLAMEFEPEVSV
jgi:hypothetical protein